MEQRKKHERQKKMKHTIKMMMCTEKTYNNHLRIAFEDEFILCVVCKRHRISHRFGLTWLGGHQNSSNTTENKDIQKKNS